MFALIWRVSRPGKSWLANEHVATIRAPRMIGTYVKISMVINEGLANLAEERKGNGAEKWPAINFLYERLRKILLHRDVYARYTGKSADE